jgi:Ca2+-transporting ATPase
MTVAVLTALVISLGLGMVKERAVTISFLTLALCQLWHVFNLRERGTTVRSNDIVRNPYVWAALVICVVLLVMAAYVPVLASVLRIESPGVLGWLIAVGMSLVPCVVGQLLLSRKAKA